MFKQETHTKRHTSSFSLDGSDLNLDDFSRLISGDSVLKLPLDETLYKKLAESVDVVSDALIDGQAVYGVTTGFGGMSNVSVDCQQAQALQANLLTFLAASAGPEIDACHTRGAMLLRANVLLKGKSGIRAEVVERLLQFVAHNATPVVRELGSIGASGDLLPLSTVARAVTGQSGRSKVRVGDEVVDAENALKQLKLKPIELRAKEGLALVNGTSFSCSVAANSSVAATESLSITFAIQSMLMSSLLVDRQPFAQFVHHCKPHPGQVWSAQTISRLLKAPTEPGRNVDTVHDRYSLRCFPQYTGSLVEGIARIRKVVETEMNAVSDNPLVDPEQRRFYQSGNFLGQYVGIAMDDLRRYIGLLAKHVDVQIATLVAPEFNNGLSASLRGSNQLAYNMGLKGLQICGNSIVPTLTWMANPIVEHFPTHAEQFNQNINGLSWGAATAAWKSIEMFRQYLAVACLFAVQAIDLRAKQTLDHFDGRQLLGPVCENFYEAICESLSIDPTSTRPYLLDDSDRWLEQDIEALAADIALGQKGSLVSSVESVTADFRDFCEQQR